MKKISIIGANSYIARNVLQVLKFCKDVDIRLYDYADKHADDVENYQQIDILSKTSIKKLDLNCDIIFMFVGKTGSVEGFNNYDDFLDVNEKALLNLLNEYRKQGSIAKIIFPSTRLIYKGSTELLKEDSKKEFKTIYAMNKFACEQYLRQYHCVYGINYCIFRICIPYGSLIRGASSYGTIKFMIDRAKTGKDICLYGDGEARRTITYIGDLAQILIKGAFTEECLNDVYNVGGENYSLKEIAEAVAAKYKVGVKCIPWPETEKKIETGNTVFDDEKLRGIIGNMAITRFSGWLI